MNETSSIPVLRGARSRAWRLACVASVALHGVVWAWCGAWTWNAGDARAADPEEFVFELRLRPSGSASEPGEREDGALAREAPLAAREPVEPAPDATTVLTEAPAIGTIESEPLVAPEPTFAPSIAAPPPLPLLPSARDPRAFARELEPRRPTRPTPTNAPTPAPREAARAGGGAASGSAAQVSESAVASHAGAARGDGPSGLASAAASGANDAGALGTSDAGAEGTRDVVAISTPRPIYPHESELYGEEGVVTCLLHVDERGLVTRVDVLETSGHRRLDRAAVDGLRRWRFEPALVAGRPVAGTLRHQVRFVFR